MELSYFWTVLKRNLAWNIRIKQVMKLLLRNETDNRWQYQKIIGKHLERKILAMAREQILDNQYSGSIIWWMHLKVVTLTRDTRFWPKIWFVNRNVLHQSWLIDYLFVTIKLRLPLWFLSINSEELEDDTKKIKSTIKRSLLLKTNTSYHSMDFHL